VRIEKILILEDNDVLRKEVASYLRELDYEATATSTIKEAREAMARDDFDLFLSDMRLPDGESIQLLRELELEPEKPLVIVMTAFGSIGSAVDYMRHGAFDYLNKPFPLEELNVVLQKAENFNQLIKVNHYFSREDPAESGELLLGNSAVIKRVQELVRKIARTEATVLIHGESGTGKELVARSLHTHSPRASLPFIRVNCAAIPENLIESEFFGHEKGAFTGAASRREGRFELAHQGTILLDEISEVSHPLQAKLLRVLQEREFERIGSSKTIKVDVRVIATTNRHLEECIERGEFRQDLYFRLNVVPIHLPPLRERKDDIMLLAEHFIERSARKNGVQVRSMSEACRAALLDHSWPGNVRELQNVIERAVILCMDSDQLQVDHLGLTPYSTRAGAVTSTRLPEVEVPAETDRKFHTLDEVEKHHILMALERCRGNRTHAAKVLGISVRTLRNKLNEYSGKGLASISEPSGPSLDTVSVG
jgi:DNA-binding NtrC family response regulator